jgi:hypothetical protein
MTAETACTTVLALTAYKEKFWEIIVPVFYLIIFY